MFIAYAPAQLEATSCKGLTWTYLDNVVRSTPVRYFEDTGSYFKLKMSTPFDEEIARTSRCMLDRLHTKASAFLSGER